MNFFKEIIYSYQQQKYLNEYSLIYGWLCFLVVYMHSSGVFAYSGKPPGFDVYSLGTDNEILKNFLHSITSTTVPIFFILWGVLSKKYVGDKSPAKLFILSKFFQFYPLYLCSVLLSLSNTLLDRGIAGKDIFIVILSALGLAPLFFGAHIIYPLIMCILTIAVMKKINCNRAYYIGYLVLLFVCGIFLYDANNSFHVKYTIFYVSFLVGVIVDVPKKISEISNIMIFDKIFYIAVSCFGVMTLISNTFSLDIVSDNINSVSTLALSFFVLQLYFLLAERILVQHRNYSAIKGVAVIGNNAYAHFIIHYHVMNLLFSISVLFGISDFLIQIILIVFTSVISVFIVNPIWMVLYQKTFLRLKIIVTHFFNYSPIHGRDS